MKSRAALAAFVALSGLALPAPAQNGQAFQPALPGYKYEFPRDYFDHPDYQTEWWYYTGNVKTPDGRRFGFELTFFRQGITRSEKKTGAWDVRDVYMAHLALSDLDGERFYRQERINRAGPGIAGANEYTGRIWNGNWSVQWKGDTQDLRAFSEQFALDLQLNSAKPPVINGKNGVSQKAEGPGRASHYISLTRLNAAGKIVLRGKEFFVKGLAWMDHEFFTQQLEANQAGWDWAGIQLENKTELMLFRIRRKDGSIDPYSAGTFVDAQGGAQQLEQKDFEMEPDGRIWTSPATEAKYPTQWKIRVPKLGLQLELTTDLREQEMTGDASISPSYWEGAVKARGTLEEKPIQGAGYLEMTGYAAGGNKKGLGAGN